MGADPGYKTTDRKPGPGAFPLVVSSGPDRRFGIRFHLATAIVPPNDPLDKRSYSATDAIWTGTPIYLNGNRSTDPWYPRNSSVRLGGRLDPSIENKRDRDGIPIDYFDDPDDPTEPIDWRYSRDNITNYDGNGASL